MRYQLVISMMIVCLFSLFQGNEVQGDEFGRNGNLILLIKSSKPKFEIGESILITASLKNHTDEPLFVNQRFRPSVDIQWDLFHDGFGPVPIKKMPAQPLKESDFIRLEVSEEIVRQLSDLSDIIFTPLKAGRYALRLTYTNKERPKGNETWTGLIITNLLWFEINTPKRSSPNLGLIL